jgi:4-hydroxybenzoate polyprenyltransferase
MLIRALRLHQWVKNLLVFVPPVLAHRFDQTTVFHAFQAFAALSLASSAAYLVNDFSDLEADRAHPTKRMRPLASGELPVRLGLAMIPVLLAASALIAVWSSQALLISVVVYTGVTVAYSVWLKRVLALDVVLIVGLFCGRLLTGGMATDIPISPWTFAFAMFLFLSIALVKRYSELHNRRASGQSANGRRAYRTEDMPVLASLGSASAMTSVLVIALYVNGEEVRRLYRHPNLLWLICMVVLLWTSRLWLLANRGELHEDPVLFAIRDGWSLLLAASIGILMLLAA